MTSSPSVPLLASVDGRITPSGEAVVPATDEGLLRGDGAFEVVRLYGGRPFALDDHHARLARTLEGLRLEHDLDALRGEVDVLVARAEGADGLLRVVLTRGGRRVLLLEPLPDLPAAPTVRTVTYAPTRVLTQLKTLSYAANMLAGRLAREQGADEALFVTPHGRVLEGPTWTLFWVSDGELVTPPLSDHILGSITRDVVLRVVGAQERITTLDDLLGADEAFIASTVHEIAPIAAVDDRRLGETPGPVTARVADGFRRHVAAAQS